MQLTDRRQIWSRLAPGRRARDASTRVPIVRATLRGDRRSLSRRRAVHEVQSRPSGDRSRSRAPHSDGRRAANAGRTEFSNRQPTSGRAPLECHGSKPLSRCKPRRGPSRIWEAGAHRRPPGRERVDLRPLIDSSLRRLRRQRPYPGGIRTRNLAPASHSRLSTRPPSASARRRESDRPRPAPFARFAALPRSPGSTRGFA